MTPTEYLQTVLQRESPSGPVLERLNANPWLLYVLDLALEEGVMVADFQDRLKRAIFYGKTELFDDAPKCLSDKAWANTVLDRLNSDPRLIRLIHAFIGMLGEAGELQKHLRAVLFEGAALDPVNINEELGDGDWYEAVAIDANQSSQEYIWVQNDAKLEKRMGRKFSEAAVNNRNLEAERSVLEGVGCVTKAKIQGGTTDLLK